MPLRASWALAFLGLAAGGCHVTRTVYVEETCPSLPRTVIRDADGATDLWYGAPPPVRRVVYVEPPCPPPRRVVYVDPCPPAPPPGRGRFGRDEHHGPWRR